MKPLEVTDLFRDIDMDFSIASIAASVLIYFLVREFNRSDKLKEEVESMREQVRSEINCLAKELGKEIKSVIEKNAEAVDDLHESIVKLSIALSEQRAAFMSQFVAKQDLHDCEERMRKEIEYLSDK